MAEPVRPSEARVARLQALSDLHDEWVDEHLDGAGFSPEGRKSPSDYNIHYLDVNPPVEAEDEFFRRARKIMGITPDGTTRPQPG